MPYGILGIKNLVQLSPKEGEMVEGIRYGNVYVSPISVPLHF